MAVLIEMEMPEKCAECPLPYYKDSYIVCPFIDRVLAYEDVCYVEERPEDCPLIEAPDRV